MSTPPSSVTAEAPLPGVEGRAAAPAPPEAAPSDDGPSEAAPSEPPRRRRRKRVTGHLKLVPETLDVREELRERCRQTTAKLDKSHPLDKPEMERIARGLLADAGQP
ncbi:MAG: hypothetical protein AAGG46_06200, partial [Planctomycetota bacterium]